MILLRRGSVATPDVWHILPTARSGVHLAWKHVSSIQEHRVRILREHVRPVAADLVAVMAALPKELQIAHTSILESPRNQEIPLHTTTVELQLRPRRDREEEQPADCQQCGRAGDREHPILSDDHICVYCAVTPEHEADFLIP